MSIYQKNKLHIENIYKSFGDILVVDNVSLDLKENEFVSILGPSGSGKSTIFNIIAGLIKPDKGNVFIEDEDFTGKSGRVSYMYQKDLLLPWKKIIDNVALPLVVKGTNKKKAREIVQEYFKIFGLEGFEHKYPFQLSGGMRQRAALMRTYMFSKDIILLDEPFGGLDAITKRKMQYWLLDVLGSLNASIFFITHDIDEAIFLSDRIYILSERPAKVKTEIKVDLPKPRNNEIITTSRFNEIKKDIMNML
ncbi:ABC transporter ATP-binding protein [Wukongibacter baidiensis]|uniref:ABC transporter ATP-binding protein n=1 Tax=Wukongibacter baidiensis TaxID=1723361 RepID=UPI003D7FF368